MSDRLPAGFRFSGIPCGIKASAADDLALIVSDEPAVAAGVYTQNLVHAACIDWNRKLTPGNSLRAIVVNSGNANACTGQRGIDDNRMMAQTVSEELSKNGAAVTAQDVLVLSTGVIGQHLPVDRVRSGIGQAAGCLGKSADDFLGAASAIMTTDHTRKTVIRKFGSGKNSWSVAAMAKGAGMIGPSMATMLAIMVTDFPLTPDQANTAVRAAANQSFNRISVEGHTSTNDACLLLAPPASKYTPTDAERSEFQRVLNECALKLARMIPADGEGASHLIHISITGASDEAGAERVARTIAMSNLVKTAVSGADPNWGRIVSAAGYAGVQFDLKKTSLSINGTVVFQHGEPSKFDAKSLSRLIREQFDTEIGLCLGDGPGQSEHWTSDLTADYVRLNAEYTT